MDCAFCKKTITQLDLSQREKIPSVPGKDATSGVCGACVQKLLSMSEEQLNKGLRLALEKGEAEKAQVFEKFLTIYQEEEIQDGHNKRYASKRSNRTRSMRAIRNDQKSAWKAPERKGFTFHQAVQHQQTLF